jgi:hypothetical protein
MDEEALKAIETRAQHASAAMSAMWSCGHLDSCQCVENRLARSVADVPALVAEVRRLRAIEAAAREFHEADEATVAAWADFGAAGGTVEAHERYRAAEERRTAARSALSREVPR